MLLITLEERRDPITVYIPINQLDEVDNIGLLLTKMKETREMGGYNKKLRKEDT